MEHYKATPEQWAEVEGYGDPLDPSPIAGCSCLLELRARVEALEAAQPKQITQEELAKLIAQPARVVPLATASAGSLVKRVNIAIDSAEYDESEHRWDEARAAIREVAAWMTGNPDVYFPPALVFALELEAGR
jgi:hypothetical protein